MAGAVLYCRRTDEAGTLIEVRWIGRLFGPSDSPARALEVQLVLRLHALSAAVASWPEARFPRTYDGAIRRCGGIDE
jgi:hypothetical protein